jgi:hypothetical protein
MGPKIESVLRFLREGGKQAIIASAGNLRSAVAGGIGTHMFPDPTDAGKERGTLIEVPAGGH